MANPCNMMYFSHILFLSLCACALASENKRSAPESEQRRCRVRFSDEVENPLHDLSEVFDTVSLSDLSPSERLLAFSDHIIPSVSRRDLRSMFEESIENVNLGLIKLFHKHGKLSDLLDLSHLEILCQSSSPDSFSVLEFVCDKIHWLEISEESDVFGLLLMVLSQEGYINHFILLWNTISTALSFSHQDFSTLAIMAIKMNSPSTYRIISERACGSEEESREFPVLVLREAIIKGYGCRVLEYLFVAGASESDLTLDEMSKVLLTAAKEGHVTLTETILFNAPSSIFATLSHLHLPPWTIALRRDHPGVFKLYMERGFVTTSMKRIIMDSISRKSEKMLFYFRSIGEFTEEIGLMIAISSINYNNPERFRLCVRFADMDLEKALDDGMTLLAYAVQKNSLEIVDFLLKDCRVCADASIVQTLTTEPGVSCHCTALFFASTPEMVRLLALHGAHLNHLNFEIESASTAPTRYFTKLQSAIQSDDPDIIAEIIKLSLEA
jgi:hypothetical protein